MRRATDTCPAGFIGVAETCYCLIAPWPQVLPPCVCQVKSLCEFSLCYSQTELDELKHGVFPFLLGFFFSFRLYSRTGVGFQVFDLPSQRKDSPP